MIAELARPVLGRSAATWAFAALLVVWGNAASILLGATAVLPGGSITFAVGGLVLAAVSLAVARTLGLDAPALGLTGRHTRGALIGVALGAGAALCGVAALTFGGPLLVGHAVAYEPLARVSASQLLLHVAVLLPLGVVVPEELAFRSVLLGLLAREAGRRNAIVGSAAIFALWHASVIVTTVADTTVGARSPWTPVAIIGAVAVVAAGGAVLGWLRTSTRTVATTIAAHWSFNAAVLLSLWAIARGQ